MTRVVLSGALYSFCLPDGGWGALYPGSHIQTSDGRVSLPGEDVLFLVGCRFNGEIFLAGQGQVTGTAWLHDGEFWQNTGSTFGVSPCAFGDGSLFVAERDTYRQIALAGGLLEFRTVSLGSQGIRYIEHGVPVSGDATYTAPSGQLHEYTIRGTVMAGQGHEADLLVNGRVLEPGDWRFVRFEREGDALSIAAVSLPHHQAVLHWLTTADIAKLPLPNMGTNEPIPPVPPETVPMSLQAPNQIAAVKSAITAHPEVNTRDEGQRGAILDYVCAALGGFPWGRKSRNKDGTDLNTDGLTFKRQDNLFEIYDVLDGNSGQATWDGFGPFKDGENGYWVPALPVGTGTSPVPPQSATVSVLTASGAAKLEAAISTLEARVKALEAVKPVEQKPISIEGMSIALQTSSGHYVCAEGGGGGELNATRTSVGGWETFTIKAQLS